MQPRFVMRNLPQLQEYLKTVPYGAVKVGLRAFTEYIIGDESHGLKHPDPYKYVSRKSAYGVSFFTEKQRRWFWANGGPDMIGNNRTGQSSNAWEMKETRGGYGTLYLTQQQPHISPARILDRRDSLQKSAGAQSQR